MKQVFNVSGNLSKCSIKDAPTWLFHAGSQQLWPTHRFVFAGIVGGGRRYLPAKCYPAQGWLSGSVSKASHLFVEHACSFQQALWPVTGWNGRQQKVPSIALQCTQPELSPGLPLLWGALSAIPEAIQLDRQLFPPNATPRREHFFRPPRLK